MKSINQHSIKHAKGDYENYRVANLLLELEKIGYSPINGSAYKEQSYYAKSLERNTAHHGKFAVHLTTQAYKNIGLIVLASNDCQFPVLVYSGIILNGEVLPMIEILNVKHIPNQLGMLDHFDLIANEINLSNEKLIDLCLAWGQTKVNSADCKQAFDKLNNYKASLMNCLQAIPVLAGNKFDLFKELILNLVHGEGRSVIDLKKIRKIRELRRIRQLTAEALKIIG